MAKSRTNQEWLVDLAGEGPAQEAAIADLRDLLLRAALYFFSRSPGDLQGMGRQEWLQRAEDCAQEASIAVLGHLKDFRGDSRFSTWAYKFAINIALVAARRQRWKGVSLDELEELGEGDFFEWNSSEGPDAPGPEQSALQMEVQGVIRQVIRQDLTDRQRQVLVLMVFQQVPLDEVVRHLGSNRNAVYKLLHDARRKLKHGLEQHGFDVSETLGLFGRAR